MVMQSLCICTSAVTSYPTAQIVKNNGQEAHDHAVHSSWDFHVDSVSIVVGDVEREADLVQPLNHLEVAMLAGREQRPAPASVVKFGAGLVQRLGLLEVAMHAGFEESV